MDGLLLNALLIGIVGVTVLIAILAVHLWRVSIRLRSELHGLKIATKSFGNDLAALRRSGVCRDDKISDHSRLLRQLEERLQDLGHYDKANQAFHAAISAARRGADVAMLVEAYGLNRDAAELLVRLHGTELGCGN